MAVAFMLAGLLCALAVSAAAAASSTQARDAARKSANAWTAKHYGIGFSMRGGWRMWQASCQQAGGGWSCAVRMSNGQCAGTVHLTARLRGYRYRIACGE